MKWFMLGKEQNKIGTAGQMVRRPSSSSRVEQSKKKENLSFPSALYQTVSLSTNESQYNEEATFQRPHVCTSKKLLKKLENVAMNTAFTNTEPGCIYL